MNALVAEIIKKTYTLRVVDVSSESISFSEEIDDDDDDLIELKPGMAFWDGNKPYPWSFEEAARSKTTPGPETTDNWSRFRVVFAGAAKTGTKTSFITRYTRGTFSENLSWAFGTDFYSHSLIHYSKEMRLMLFDTRTNLTNSCRQPSGIVIGYDITNKASLDKARQSYASLWKEYPFAVIMVIGNKLDLEDTRRAVTTKEGEALARDLQASLFFEVSAKTGEGVFESMEALADIMYRRANKMQIYPVLPKVSEQPGTVPSGNAQEDITLKVCFIGPVSTGAKSSFILRYCRDEFDENIYSTMSIALQTKKVFSGNRCISLQLWDSSGNERYDSVLPIIYRASNGFVVGYDITNRLTLDDARRRFRNLKLYGAPDSIIMVIGNKADLEEQRVVPTEDGEALARELGASLFFESKKEKKSTFLKIVFICLFCLYSICEDWNECQRIDGSVRGKNARG